MPTSTSNLTTHIAMLLCFKINTVLLIRFFSNSVGNLSTVLQEKKLQQKSNNNIVF